MSLFQNRDVLPKSNPKLNNIIYARFASVEIYFMLQKDKKSLDKLSECILRQGHSRSAAAGYYMGMYLMGAACTVSIFQEALTRRMLGSTLSMRPSSAIHLSTSETQHCTLIVAMTALS